MVVGAVAGAVLMAMAVVLVFWMGTGIPGGIIYICTMAVAGGIGYLIGFQKRIRKNNIRSHRQGYRDGLGITTTLWHCEGRHVITVLGEVESADK
jgi:uncharacterized membrane protein SpoIIM required for sporulation